MKVKGKIYALYENDKFITLGTYEQISKETGITINTLRSIRSRSRSGKKTGLILIEIVGEYDE